MVSFRFNWTSCMDNWLIKSGSLPDVETLSKPMLVKKYFGIHIIKNNELLTPDAMYGNKVGWDQYKIGMKKISLSEGSNQTITQLCQNRTGTGPTLAILLQFQIWYILSHWSWRGMFNHCFENTTWTYTFYYEVAKVPSRQIKRSVFFRSYR